MTATARYTTPARCLHWLMAVVILATFTLALVFDGMRFSPGKIALINYHKWLGVLVLVLLALRALWRWRHPPPALPDTLPRREQQLAHVAHAALYGLMLAVPMLGWLYSSAKGYPLVWLGWLPLPALIGPDPELAKTLRDVHQWAAWGLVVLALLHAAAALRHHFVLRDGVLRRML